MTMEEQIKHRIAELEAQNAALTEEAKKYAAQMNIRLAACQGAIAELRRLLPPPNHPTTEEAHDPIAAAAAGSAATVRADTERVDEQHTHADADTAVPDRDTIAATTAAADGDGATQATAPAHASADGVLH